MTVGDAAAERDSLQAVELRVERRYANERAEKAQAQPPYSAEEIARVADWIAGVSFGEWFALTADRDAARAEAGKLHAALEAIAKPQEWKRGDPLPFERARAVLAGSDAPPTLSEPREVEGEGHANEPRLPLPGSLSAAAVPAERET